MRSLPFRNISCQQEIKRERSEHLTSPDTITKESRRETRQDSFVEKTCNRSAMYKNGNTDHAGLPAEVRITIFECPGMQGRAPAAGFLRGRNVNLKV